MRFTEVNLFGVYVAPISVIMVAAWFVTIWLRWGAVRFGLLRYVWHRHRQVSRERSWWSRVGQVNGRDDDASRSDLCRPSLPR